MKELQQILGLWEAAEKAGESAVLATVVKTRGSSYRLPGARLLLTGGGERAGSVSGGCLEDDLVKKAWWLTEQRPVIRRYDTTPEGEIATEFGLGCNGIIHVLLERVTSASARVLKLIAKVREERRAAAVVHLIEPAAAVAGERLILDTEGAVAHNLSNAELAASLAEEARRALAEGNARTIRLGRDVEAFVEILQPAVHLLIFGAGDDAVPLVNLAKFLGWQVTVLDGRAHYARREKFPQADVVLVRRAGDSGLAAQIDPWTVAVLMSHSYNQDLENLRELATRPLRYLGILGPRKRTVQLLSDAGLDPERLVAALHSPVGLDIGADGPEQVALAVLAEIQATLNGREGGMLRERDGSIHASEGAAADPEALWVQSIACA